MIELEYFAAGRYTGDIVEPTEAQRMLEQRAIFEAGILRTTMSQLTPGQQKELLRKFRTWGVYVEPASTCEVRVLRPKSSAIGVQNGAHRKRKTARSGGAS